MNELRIVRVWHGILVPQIAGWFFSKRKGEAMAATKNELRVWLVDELEIKAFSCGVNCARAALGIVPEAWAKHFARRLFLAQDLKQLVFDEVLEACR